MRGGLIIVGVIFWISLSLEPLGKLAWRKGCEVAQSRRYLNGEYTSLFNGILNAGNKSPRAFSILKQHPFHYFATEYDTIRLTGFDNYSFFGLNQINFDLTFPSMEIYDKKSIVFKLSPQWESCDRFLMEVHEGKFHYLAAAQIIQAQLDFDPELERIVRTRDDLYSTYFFYDRVMFDWSEAGSVSLMDNYGGEIDFSLEGLAGLKAWYHHPGVGCLDVQYVSIENGNLTSNFIVNLERHGDLTIGDDGLNYGLASESEILLVNADEFLVETKIELMKEAEPHGDSYTSIANQVISYSIIRKQNGKFYSNKSYVGFNAPYAGQGIDSTYFNPELYAFAEMNYLKQKGNQKQKELLKNFVYDSTATFR